MDFDKIIEKRNFVLENISKLDKCLLENYEEYFDVEFIHNSTAIEGNTLTLQEAKMIMIDNMSIGTKSLREIYEVVNHKKAWNYVKECVRNGNNLSEDIVKELHSILMENIILGGIYRTQDVRITGAKHIPPSPDQAYYELRNFYDKLSDNQLNDIELAAYTHAEFVKIHPYVDGNGRTSRLMMNYQLIKCGFLPINIKKEDRVKYYDALDEYAVNNNLDSFIKIIYDLENEQLDFYIKAIKDLES